jgi:ribosome-binding protein aMBF1 (putative translation factor)
MFYKEISRISPHLNVDRPHGACSLSARRFEMSEFGTKLINLRTELGLSVKEACQKVGIPQSRLSELERGVRIPTTSQISRLENFYETASDELTALAKAYEESFN